MSEHKNGFFVKLVKKAVGLPTGESGCCDDPAPITDSSAGTPADPKANSSCSCGSTAPAAPTPKRA